MVFNFRIFKGLIACSPKYFLQETRLLGQRHRDQQAIESILDYRFAKPQLLEEALQAAGSAMSDTSLTGDRYGNKRLALVGDAVIRLVILDSWYETGGSIGKDCSPRVKTRLTSTGDGSKIVSDWGSNNELSRLTMELGLAKYIVQNPSQRGNLSPTTLAATIEAIMGAVWIDSGKNFNKVSHVIKTLQRRGK
jgi:ribonuclease-3